MVEKVWVGKKVQVLSLEELKKNHFKDENGKFWQGKNKPKFVSEKTWEMTKAMRKFCGKIVEISEIRDKEECLSFKIREGFEFWCWQSWMVKEPLSIQDILETE